MGSPPPQTPAPGATKAGPGSLREVVRYFLYLGTFGFGGPIALAGYMQRDLVERRRWVSKQDYVEGLALAQLAPGPLAAQLAMYLGWVRAREKLNNFFVTAAYAIGAVPMSMRSANFQRPCRKQKLMDHDKAIAPINAQRSRRRLLPPGY